MLHTDIPARGVAQGQCFPPGRGPRPGRVQRASGGCRDTHPPSRRARARPRTARDSWRASLINDNDCDRSTTIAEPSSVGESGQRGRRARSPKLPRKRANTIRYVLMSSEAGQERGHARRHVVPRDDSRVKILGVIPDENRHGIGSGNALGYVQAHAGAHAADDHEDAGKAVNHRATRRPSRCPPGAGV